MRNRDISPPTEEARRREFIESASRALGYPVNLSEIIYRVRCAIEGDRAHVRTTAQRIGKALGKIGGQS